MGGGVAWFIGGINIHERDQNGTIGILGETKSQIEPCLSVSLSLEVLSYENSLVRSSTTQLH